MPVKTFDRRRLPEVQLLLESKRGHIGACADALKVSRSTLHAWISVTPELQETIEDIKQGIVDTLLIKLESLATSDKVPPAINLAAIREYLNGPAGRSRGWGAATEIKHSGSVDSTPSRQDDMMRLLIPQLSKAQLRAIRAHDEQVHADGASSN